MPPLEMTFWAALNDLMIGNTGHISDGYGGSKPLVFAVASALMGLLLVLLDRTLYSLRGRSVFNLTYGARLGTSVRLLLLWGVGAGLLGFFGASIELLQMTRAGCIGAGVGWPLIFPRLVESINKEPDDVQPQASP